MTRARAHTITTGHGRKALVALLVVVVHAWLLSLRLPEWSLRGSVHGPATSVTVQLLPPTVAPLAPQDRATPAPPMARLPPPRRMGTPPAQRATSSTAQPGAAPQPTFPSTPEGATPEPAPSQARGRVAITPNLLPSNMPTTLAERAQAHLGTARGVDALQRGIESSAKPDCRQAYAGLGHPVIAIAALVRDALREDGCKW